jgi:hypothetical protein
MGGIVKAVLDPITGAGDARRAANEAAASQRQASQTAAYGAQFRPVGMTTAFGSSQFTREIDPTTGLPYVSSAGYTASPQLANLQQNLLGNLGGAAQFAQQQGQAYAPLGGAANQLFGLGSQYLATSPEAAAQDYINKQQALLGSSRTAQLSNIRNRLFQTGRGGLGVQTGTGGAPASPEMQAYYNALAQQDLQLAAQADEAARQRTMFGAGLFGTGAGLLGTQTQGQVAAYSPLQTLLGLSGQTEQMAMQPYNLGIALGQAAAPGQAAGSQLYSQGYNQAAATQYAGAQNAANLNAGFLSSLIGSAIGGAGGGAAGGGFGGGLFGGSQGGFNFGALGRTFGVAGRTSTGLGTFD